MVKIGIITYLCAYNYGAVLQAYALQSVLEMLDCNVEFIDFRPSAITDVYDKKLMLRGKRALFFRIFRNSMLQYSTSLRNKRYLEIDRFVKEYLHVTSRSYLSTQELESANLDYDVYICGSDQVWNSKINGHERAYYLNFVRGSAKKIAYAPSFAVEKVSEDEIRWLKLLLSDFTALSAREDLGVKILKEQLCYEAAQVLDPTLLLDVNQWRDLCSGADPVCDKKYIFAYLIGESNEVLESIYRFAKQEGLEIVFVGIGLLIQPQSTTYINKSDVGPQAFLNLLLNSEYVCTNSFHGIALSILFNKKFAIKYNHDKNDRIESLLRLCRLEPQKIEKNTTLKVKSFNELIFENSNQLIARQKSLSIEFLTQCL